MAEPPAGRVTVEIALKPIAESSRRCSRPSKPSRRARMLAGFFLRFVRDTEPILPLPECLLTMFRFRGVSIKEGPRRVRHARAWRRAHPTGGHARASLSPAQASYFILGYANLHIYYDRSEFHFPMSVFGRSFRPRAFLSVSLTAGGQNRNSAGYARFAALHNQQVERLGGYTARGPK